MRNFFILTILSVFVIVPGVADASEIQSTWGGFYLGISVGQHKTSRQTVDISGSGLITGSQPTSVPYSISLDRDQAFGGLLAGYSIQSGSIVYGLEADYNFADLDDDNLISLLGGNVLTSASVSVKNLTTLRGRIGYTPWDECLLAINGGLAGADVEVDQNIDEFSGTGRQFTASRSEYMLGWVLGAEASYALTSNWLVRGDYSYYDLGDSSANRGYQSQPTLATQFADYSSIKIDGNLFRLSLIYKF